MSISKAYTAQISGLNIEIITIEVDISNGLHSFSVVGLGDRSVEESKDRISSAIKHSGYASPKQKNQKVVISLAPADIRKEGPSFDLGMAMAYLKSAGDIDFEPENILFLGELSLEGTVRKVHGLLPILTQASKYGFTTAFIPKENANEASLAKNIIVYAVSSLSEVIKHISRDVRIEPIKYYNLFDLHDASKGIGAQKEDRAESEHDISHVRGNESAKRALEIAAAGYHNIILYGPPGTGKTMLAKGLATIMPKLSYEQSIEVTSIHSVAKVLEQDLITDPPFRSPHHTASSISILGGGNNIKPGEISLAHRGILYLDEFPEFDKSVIEGLRQPLEDREITVSRAKGSVTFPAQCLFVASMNPCRCGKERGRGCVCSAHNIDQYRKRVSASILDRIDLWVNVNEINYSKLGAITNEGEKSSQMRLRISKARKLQESRFSKNGNVEKYFNSEMSAHDIETMAKLKDEARSILMSFSERLRLSGRSFHRVIRVARTIADLDDSIFIEKNHVMEALQYRQRI